MDQLLGEYHVKVIMILIIWDPLVMVVQPGLNYHTALVSQHMMHGANSLEERIKLTLLEQGLDIVSGIAQAMMNPIGKSNFKISPQDVDHLKVS